MHNKTAVGEKVAVRLTSLTLQRDLGLMNQWKLDLNKQTNLLDNSEDRERERPCETARLSSNELDNAPVDTA